jgi:serine/threonine protein kinase
MIRVKVFASDAEKTIAMMRKGVITYCDPKRIFGEFGHQRLREFSLRNNFVARPEYQVGNSPPATPEGGGSGHNLARVREWLAEQAAVKQAKQSAPVVPPAPQSAPPNSKLPTAVPPSGPPSSGIRPLGRLPSLPGRPGSVPRPGGPAPTPPYYGGPPERKPLEVGDQVGKYLLIEQIGSGGTAHVFRALHRVLNIPVAIKVLKMDGGDVLSESENEVFEQLRKEAQLLARFNHPNIVRVYDFEEESHYPFLVMEFVDGLSLSEVISHAGRLRADRAAKIILQVAEGLASAQKKTGLVHRDVKPGNILLARDGGVKLADLGLALALTWHKPKIDSTAVLAGTAAYMSPEQAQGSAEVDHRSDIYSLGATMYHAVTGEMPFKGKNRLEMILKHSQETPPPPHQVVPGVDSAYSELIYKMLAKKPDERFQTYEELIEALRSLTSRSESMISVPSTVSTPMVTVASK